MKRINAGVATVRRNIPESQPRQVHVPGFITQENVGLGDVIRHVTHAIGIKSCGGCERRAASLNRWLTFSPWRGVQGGRRGF